MSRMPASSKSTLLVGLFLTAVIYALMSVVTRVWYPWLCFPLVIYICARAERAMRRR